MEDTAINIKGVSKGFNLPNDKNTSIKSHIIHPFKRMTYQKQTALQDINIDIKKGEFFGIVGRNGSGKSTLLKIIAGIYQPTKGKVHIAGKLVPFIELGVGFNPELSGKDNVYLNGALLGFSKDQIDDMYQDIVNFSELEDHMDQKLKNYSSGMQVRLAFSVATRAQADILLVDEVLAVGDTDFQRKCFNYFKSLKNQNTTVIFVSHNMDAVQEYCDRAVLIEKSRVIASGSSSEVASKYNQLFLDAKQEEIDELTKSDNKKDRFGEGQVQFKNVSLNKRIFNDRDKNIKLEFVLEAIERPSNLMTGFRVKNLAGQSVNETNTWIEKKPLPDLEPGQKCKVIWEIPNIYADGVYTADAYIYGKDKTLILYDELSKALSFQVKLPEAQGVLTRILPKVKIERL